MFKRRPDRQPAARVSDRASPETYPPPSAPGRFVFRRDLPRCGPYVREALVALACLARA